MEVENVLHSSGGGGALVPGEVGEFLVPGDVKEILLFVALHRR